jgi:hypothetical protein
VPLVKCLSNKTCLELSRKKNNKGTLCFVHFPWDVRTNLKILNLIILRRDRQIDRLLPECTGIKAALSYTCLMRRDSNKLGMWTLSNWCLFIHYNHTFTVTSVSRSNTQATVKTCARVECLFTKRGEVIAALIIQFSKDIYLHGTSQSEEDFCQIRNITSLIHTNIIPLSYV